VRIQRITDQHRRDFTAIYECESCGATRRGHGYDDANFHQNLIPAMTCEKCGVATGKATSAPTIPAGLVL
jgi:ribosomal protein L37AE/L43A